MNLSARRLIIKLNKFWDILVYGSCLAFRLTSNDTCIGVMNGCECPVSFRQRIVIPLAHSCWQFLEGFDLPG